MASVPAPPPPPGPNQPIPPPAEGQTYDPPKLKGLMTIFTVKSPQKYFDLNREQCERLGVNPTDVFSTLQIYLGSLYVNDFNLYGRTWQVNVQAMGEYRNHEEDVRRLMVRNATNGMVPLGTVGDVTDINGPLILTRYNMYPAAAITGDVMPGVSSGDSIKMMEAAQPTRTCPKTMAYEWTEITYIQQQSGNDGRCVLGSRWACWACSWCWPPCTRAGRCRWPSSSSCRCACSARSPASGCRTNAGGRPATSTSSRRSASSYWSAWRARMRS